MKIYFSQIYIRPGITFPFSHQFQIFMSEEVTRSVSSSAYFNENYGEDWNLIFRISAKDKIEELEICGPTKFKKDGDVEYSLFLPFDRIDNGTQQIAGAVESIFDGVFSVLSSLGVSLSELNMKRGKLVEEITNNPEMVKINEI